MAHRTCNLLRHLPALIGSSLMFSAAADANAFNSRDEKLFQHLADPTFYVHAHRREAVADGLAMIETLLAASGTYREPREAGPLLVGSPSVALRLLAAGGGRAGEIARIMLREAENGIYGDPDKAIRGHVPASSEGTVEFRIQPGETRRLVLGSSGSGRLLFGGTCGMELRELPRNEHGQIDVHAGRPDELHVSGADTPAYRLEAISTAFGVALAADCGEAEQTLLVAWAPSPPSLKPESNGHVVIRQPGRYQIEQSGDGTAVEFRLPDPGYYKVSSPDSSVDVHSGGLGARDQHFLRGGQASGWVELSGRKYTDLLVTAVEVPRLSPGEVLDPRAGETAMLFEVAVPNTAARYLLLETLTSDVNGDPMLYAFNANGDIVAQDDDSGGALNALLEVEARPGTVQTFMVIDRDEQGVQPVRISVNDFSSMLEGE